MRNTESQPTSNVTFGCDFIMRKIIIAFSGGVGLKIKRYKKIRKTTVG